MMKRLKITNTHGLTITDLRIQEKQESNAFFCTCIMAVRLVMQGKLGKEAAEICGIHRQSVSEYVKRFNEGGMDLLLERKMAPGRACFLTDDQQQALKEIILTSTPTDQGLGRCLRNTFFIMREVISKMKF